MENQSKLTVELDGSKLPSMRSFYSEMEEKLKFPDHFGHNLDALLDCLCDLAHLEKSEVVLHILHPEKFLGKAKKGSREVVLEILKEAALPENRYDEVKFSINSDT